MNKIELLAPAGSMESLIGAVTAGADAVYLGGSKFSARAYANNFNEEQMAKAIDYCHIYDVKVYVTLNTLLKEEELEEAFNYACFLYEIGVDALIIQDFGLMQLLRIYLPDFEIHASTQMTIHNGEGALFLKNAGFKRIVLSRELSLEDITYISKDLGIETEVFIHGALCICYSGQCLMSSIIGGRSGNRGRCAQPCRLPYKILNKTLNLEKQGYIMSPKDICTLDNIEELINTGTSSLKIEGRMKRPEYVAGVVSAYRKAIDSVYENRSFNLEKERKMLLQLFNREGFSKAYFFGNEGKGMMSYTFPKNTGIYLGKVQNDLSIIAQEPIRIKDGVRIGEDGFIVSSIIKEGNEVAEAYSGDKVKLKPFKYKVGDELYKTSDLKLLEELSCFYKEEYIRKKELELKVNFQLNELFCISANFMGKDFKVYGDKVQEAINKPIDKEKLISNLNKTGNTPFNIDKITFETYEQGFLPLSSINNSRRELLNSIENFLKNQSKRELPKELKENTIAIHKNVKKFEKDQSNIKSNTMPKLLVTVSSEEQLRGAVQFGIENIAIDMFNRKGSLSIDNCKVKNLYLKIPNIIRDKEFNYVCEIIQNNLNEIEGIITGNLGIINKFHHKTNIIGDYKLNIFNSKAMEFLSTFTIGNYLSAEINKKEIKILKNNINETLGVVLYGRYELMVSEYCPIGAFYGEKEGKNPCKVACSKGEYYLKDRKDEEFLISVDKFCRSYIYNSAVTNILDFKGEFENVGIRCFRLDFIDESLEETLEVLNSFVTGKMKNKEGKYTKGHYKRGIE